MRLLFLGDVVGRSGRNAVIEELPKLRARYKLDFVAINGENAAGGFGITEAILEELLVAGADVVTLGNHSWDQKEALVFIERQERCCGLSTIRPARPAKASGLFKARNGADVPGDQRHGPHLHAGARCPFRAVDRELGGLWAEAGATPILIDFHAEATSEKQAIGYYVDGRASCVVGTHTHAPTADERVLPEGHAFVSDIGMCGDYESVLGMDPGEPLNRFLTKIPRGRFEPAMGPATISGLAVEIDDATGLALRTTGLRLGGVLAPTEPLFWVE
jgi:metallophosphoesterase (TIGR00282 family)